MQNQRGCESQLVCVLRVRTSTHLGDTAHLLSLVTVHVKCVEEDVSSDHRENEPRFESRTSNVCILIGANLRSAAVWPLLPCI